MERQAQEVIIYYWLLAQDIFICYTHIGLPGKQGVDGIPGARGPPGKYGIPGRAGPPGKDGLDGQSGRTGPPGKDVRLLEHHFAIEHHFIFITFRVNLVRMELLDLMDFLVDKDRLASLVTMVYQVPEVHLVNEEQMEFLEELDHPEKMELLDQEVYRVKMEIPAPME